MIFLGKIISQKENESESIAAIAKRVSNSNVKYSASDDLQQRIDEFADNIYKFANKLDETKRRIKEQFDEICELGKTANIPNEELGKLLRDAFHKRGVSDSYVRKIMPPELRVLSHTNVRYLETEKGDIDNNSSVPVLPQPSNIIESGNTMPAQNDGSNTNLKPQLIYPESQPQVSQAIAFDEEIKNLKHELVIKSKQIQRYENDLENLKQELKETRHILKEDSFVARTYLTLGDNDVPIKITVNIAKKEIESAEIDNEALKSAMMRAK